MRTKDRIIIGFVGAAGSGKDTAAESLIAQGWKRKSFADPLKSYCSHAFQLPILYFNDPQLKDAEFAEPFKRTSDKLHEIFTELGGIGYPTELTGAIFRSPRQILQFVGTDIARNLVGGDVWVNRFLDSMELEDGNIVITDVRFRNEARAIKDMGGYVVKIKRRGTGGGSHASETELNIICSDYLIENDETKEDLKDAVEDFVQLIRDSNGEI